MTQERLYIKCVLAVLVVHVIFLEWGSITSAIVSENHPLPVCDKSMKCSWDKEFRIAWFAPAREYYNFSASSSVSALKLALTKIDKLQLLHGYTVNIKWYDSDCNSKTALAAAVDARMYFDPDVFIGPPCSNGLLGVAQLGSHWNLPVFSWVSDHLDFKDTGKFNTLFRLAGPLSSISESFRVFPKYFDWKRFSMIYDKQTPYETVATAIRDFPMESYTLYGIHDITVKASHEEIRSLLLQVRKYTRIILFVVPWHDLRRYLLVAHELGMANGEYVFICVHGDRFTWDVLDEKVFSAWGWRRNDSDDGRAREIFESVIHIIMEPLPREMLSGFHKAATEHAANTAPNWDLPFGLSSDAYAPYLYDSMMVWARTVNLTVTNEGNPRNGSLILKMVSNATDVKWVTGFIVFRTQDSRDRMFNYIILDMAKNGTFYRLFTFEFKKGSMRVTTDNQDALLRKGYWPTKDGKHPPDIPLCGFDGEKCPKNEGAHETYTGTIIGASVSASIVLILAIVVHLMLRRYRRLQLLQSMLWQVRFEEIDFVTAWINNSIRNSFKNLQKRRTFGKAARKAQYKSQYSGTVLHRKKTEDNSPETVQKPIEPGTIFGQVAYVRGNLTSVKRIQNVNLNLTKDVILELNQLIELKHQNTCAFVGACLDPSRAILLWEYCSKGSLQDVIWNQNIKLDQLFMYALCLDAAKGLDFIHKSSVHYHGNLKSTNCVVDSRWTLKLADFGVQKIRDLARLTALQSIENHWEEKLLWTAPECLRNRKDVDRQKADIYALGIIIKEVFTRSGPYSEYPFYMSHEILAKVKDHDPGFKVFRPMIPRQLRQNVELTGLIEDCWSEEPTKRPSAQRVVKTLNRLNPSKNVSMIDNMIAMLEKYANHLEELVAERTSELDAEKKKTENLLYRMLPQTVAEELKLGRPIKAEDFDEATIYFSDIVGFTNICTTSTPIEVVNLLNSLYTLFDDIITRFDIYKVETIGDAYMIASGLPKRNGKRHIKEIADCALDIMASVYNFCIPHQPDKTVKIRMGIHTGPVVAGVVGLAMPRYCLFGDTVNTASRMESTGLPLRIHLSQKSKEALEVYEGYDLYNRGEISVKGKGVMNTYFLRGRRGFNKELPKWDEEKDKNPPSPKKSTVSISSLGSSCHYGTNLLANSPSPLSSRSLSEIWDERYKSKQTNIMEITCL